VTLQARGIIFNKVTGELVAFPFVKFFNLGEMPQSSIGSLPSGPFTVTEKLDGSLGISLWHKGQPYIATRGSFQSDQAQWGTRWLREHVATEAMDPRYTYLFEILYHDNKIVIDYGDFEGLVLLSCINKETGEELPYEAISLEAKKIGVTVVRRETGFTDIEQLYTYCKGLPHSKEGFVVTFSNGLKVKMKGDAYCAIHKIISQMTPLAFWDAWDLEMADVPKEFLAQIPEEFRETADQLYNQIHALHWDMYNKAALQYAELRQMYGSAPTAKDVALAARDRFKETFSCIMYIHKGQTARVWDTIHKTVRPTGNVMPSGNKGAERLNRILQES
jgi:RNA ligase